MSKCEPRLPLPLANRRRLLSIALCIMCIAVASTLPSMHGRKSLSALKQTYVYNSLSDATITERTAGRSPTVAALDTERTTRMAALTDIPYGQVILPAGNKPYWLKKGAVVTHATSTPYIAFKEHAPSWFSPTRRRACDW